MEFKKYTIIIFITAIFLSCASNPKSFYSDGEKIAIKLDPNDGQSLLATGTTLALAAPELINIGIKSIKSLITNEQKKYTQSYSTSKNDDNFYQTLTGELSYSGFTVTRKVTPSNEITDDIASKLAFKFIIDDETKAMMAIKPTSIEVNSTKSKLKKDDSNVDLLVNIVITAYWVIKEKNNPSFNSSEIASVSFKIKELELGTKYDEKSDQIKNKTSEWFSAIPVSIVDDNILDCGKFKIEVTVTESDKIEKRFEKLANKLDASEELLKILLKDAFNIEE